MNFEQKTQRAAILNEIFHFLPNEVVDLIVNFEHVHLKCSKCKTVIKHLITDNKSCAFEVGSEDGILCKKCWSTPYIRHSLSLDK
jgi:hypothetical protein